MQIKSVTSRNEYYKWIPIDNRYEYFLYPHVNGAGTCIIVFVPVNTRTRYTLI